MISTWAVVFAGACIGVIANTRLVARLEDKIPLGGPRGAVVLLLLIPALVIATSLLLGGVLAALEVRRRGSRCWRVSRGAGVSGPPRVTSSPPGRPSWCRRDCAPMLAYAGAVPHHRMSEPAGVPGCPRARRKRRTTSAEPTA